MILSDLKPGELRERLSKGDLILGVGPFSFELSCPLPQVAEALMRLYADYPVLDRGEFVDFSVCISGGKGWRRWFRRQAIFTFDGLEPFVPLPEKHAFPLLEWAMNWCVSMHTYHYLLLHSAVIERDGCAVIMPAPPGSGKSTLCAGLVNRGWRLLSDELALISLKDLSITPFGRPISLKNQSIDIIRNYVPEAVFSRVVHDTSKGTVSHMKVRSEHLARIKDTARPRWVIFPRYVAGSKPVLSKRSKADSLLELGRNSFNYLILGKQGFDVLADVVDSCDCYDFEYSQLDGAVAVFDELVAGRTGEH
ncbi:HprK-related kinase A [Hydrogenophaga sp.]|uniref:HprK-related kinase A n=1 Tax=Hydrogenophaga sp. TaxID=1904254 RepID=UPI0025C13B9F|nr:HprK-related kinase A [Hydrogenophaga sp.]MBT9465212.1 HprK-related kinase A [Hydrogenophaga sp.]